jgi:hypothetical protein
VALARRAAHGASHVIVALNAQRTKELRELGHVPTPPRPQTGFARGRLSPKSRPHLFCKTDGQRNFSSAITTTVPDIRLHNPAITVATMTK